MMKEGFYWIRIIAPGNGPAWTVGQYSNGKWQLMGDEDGPYTWKQLEDVFEIGPYLGTKPENKE